MVSAGSARSLSEKNSVKVAEEKAKMIYENYSYVFDKIWQAIDAGLTYCEIELALGREEEKMIRWLLKDHLGYRISDAINWNEVKQSVKTTKLGIWWY